MKKDLSGTIFTGTNNKEYIVLAGYENQEIAFVKKDNPNGTLYFCCDSIIENDRLYSSYKVSYTVNKAEFFSVIDGTDPLNSLKEKYYKIPKVFLKLVVKMYLKERWNILMDLHEGNLFFKHKYPTVSIERAVEKFNTFEEFEKFFESDLMDENLLLGDFLFYLLDKYNVSANKAALEIGKSHSYVRKIVSGDELNPSRDVLLAICVYIGATVEETQILLRYAGKSPLYARRKRDVIVWFALRKKQNLTKLNIYLECKGYAPLSKLIVHKEK